MYRDKEKGTRLEGGAQELQALQEAKKPKHEKPSWGGGIAQVCLFPMSQFSICACCPCTDPTFMPKRA